ncbi:MAG: hypothetical protein HKN32_10615, partial [Flavobacteriales bacterium]|nr:hypothetical protein [Flavobacteriales bacterium]
MDEKRKYDPEDIESLLLHKEYVELYPEEKKFVLEHMDSIEEYDSMRKTLLSIQQTEGPGRIEPREGMKEALLAEFASERRGGFVIWLNSLFG